MPFSWVPFYRELAGRVLEFEDRQDELLAILREMQKDGLKTVPLEDDLSPTERVPLKELDPFTFMATFSRSGDQTAKILCDWIRQKWDLQTPTPTDFDGRTNVAAVGGGSWFFTSTEYRRTPQDIPLMWQLARIAFNEGLSGITEDLYSRCIKVENIGVLKLTTGLYWFNSRDFLPLVGPMISYLREHDVRCNEKLLLQKPNCKWEEYLQLIKKARAFNPNFVALSHDAWVWRNEEPASIVAVPTLSSSNSKLPLNQILYGPPGTGKTFRSVSKAVELIDGFAPENRAECQERFHELRAKGQIGFVTFHQSFSYEEFIEGLRPVITDKVGEVRYEIRDGILKTMALRAVENHQLKEVSGPSFEEVWNEFARRIEEKELKTLPGRTPRSIHQLIFLGEVLEGENILSKKDARYFTTTKEKQQKIWDKLPHDQEADGGHIGDLKVGSEGSNSFNAVIFNKLTQIKNELRLGSGPKRFVLIIDEINRGNISKIFGELITLLEDDKRIGEPNELRVTLPTSGKEFALPPNLFVLGTMNTADKSLAQLDVALRRRFDFEELAPRPELCKGLALLPEVLGELNARLEWALDREHRLGHAYFLDVTSESEFNARFGSKIVPLLLEYFPHDFKTLRSVLGEEADGFLRAWKAPSPFKGPDKFRWWFECGDTHFSAWAQLKTNFHIHD